MASDILSLHDAGASNYRQWAFCLTQNASVAYMNVHFLPWYVGAAAARTRETFPSALLIVLSSKIEGEFGIAVLVGTGYYTKIARRLSDRLIGIKIRFPICC